MRTILSAIDISKVFGGLMALNKINFEVETGKIVGIIGPNGAGKTTLFNCLTGLYFPSEGKILFQDQSIVPEASTQKMRLVQRCSIIFIVLSLIWVPLFWSFFLPRTYYKVELGLLTILLFLMRWIIHRGFKVYQIWAWGVMFVFLFADFYFAIHCVFHPESLGQLLGTSVPLAYFAIPWSVCSMIFCPFLIWQLILHDVRQLYGFRTGPDAICRFGIARTFQNIRLFLNLSVLDNVKIGCHVRIHSGLWGTIFRTGSQKNEEKTIEQQAFDYLKFVGIDSRVTDLAGELAYGEQRRLEIARALASEPKLLLLDEPAAGMNPQESFQLIQLIRTIRDRGITVVIIEHDMKVMMNLADKIYVLDHGDLIGQGTPDEIRNNPDVIKAYLGGSTAYA